MSVLDKVNPTSNGVLAFSWTGDAYTHIEPMVWITMSESDLATEGSNAATALAAKDAGRRCLFLRHLFTDHVTLDDIGTGCTWRSILTHGYPTSAWAEELTKALVAYRDADGPTPDLIVVDWETHHSWFKEADAAARAAQWAKVIESPGAMARLPARCRSLTAANIQSVTAASSANSFVRGDVDRTLGDIANDTLRVVITQCWIDVFGEACPPISQYETGDAMARDHIDGNGWTLPAIPSTVSGISSPPLYCESSGQWYSGGLTAAQRCFANMVLNVHRLRGTRGRVLPWVSSYEWKSGGTLTGSSIAGPQAFVEQLFAHGITTILLWNPYANGSQNTAVNNQLKAGVPKASPMAYARYVPSEIMDMDTPTVETGTLETAFTAGDWA